MRIQDVHSRDARFQLDVGAGSDAVHSAPQYPFAVTRLTLDTGVQGIGLALTMGTGNDLVCRAIEIPATPLIGVPIEELMAGFGTRFRTLADEPQLRWLGPHKGVVHRALASITSACFDLWAKTRREPLWSVLLNLSPAALVNLLDLSYLEDELSRDDALQILEDHQSGRSRPTNILEKGYPGYDTSIGWFQYDSDRIQENARRALDQGFAAFRLKVGGSLLL